MLITDAKVSDVMLNAKVQRYWETPKSTQWGQRDRIEERDRGESEGIEEKAELKVRIKNQTVRTTHKKQ